MQIMLVSSRGSPRSGKNDIRASVHIVEVLVVGLMVMGAVVSVSTLHNTVERGDENPLNVGEDKAREALDVLRALPAENTSVHHTHRLEELMLQDLAGDSSTLPSLLRSYHFVDHRLVFQTGDRNTVVAGPQNLSSQDVPDGASAHWYSRLGTTLIRPTVSHQDAEMVAWFELLPVWADHVPTPPGHAWDVEVALEGADGWHNQTTVFSHRLPLDDQDPVRVEPLHTDGTDAWAYTESMVTNGTHYEWDVHLRITAGTEPNRAWLGQGDTWEILPPPGWSLSDLDASWKDLTEGDEAIWRLEHTGQSMRGDDEAWLNLTLKRSTDDSLTHPEILRARTTGPTGAEVSMVLSPDLSRTAPVVVAASRPDPFPVDASLPVTLTITNPTGSTLDLDRLLVNFTAAAQFPYTPSGWTRTATQERVTYEYQGPAVQIAPYSAEPVTLDIQVQNNSEGDNQQRVQPPVIEYLGAGNLSPPKRDGLLPESSADPARRSLSAPHTQAGLWRAWLNVDDLENGTHTTRVGHFEEDRIPPGTGSFTRVNESTQDFLPGLQEIRHNMGITLEPMVLAPGGDLVVTLDTATLASYLSDHTGRLTGDALRFEVDAGDLVGHVTGEPETNKTLTLQPAALSDGDTLELSLPFSRSATPGPLIVDARLVIPTQDHQEVRLQFLASGTLSSEGQEFTPVFFNAHLQYWLGGMQEGPEVS